MSQKLIPETSLCLIYELNQECRKEPIVEKRFRILAHISNQLRKHVKKQLSRLEKDKVYQELKKNTDD